MNDKDQRHPRLHELLAAEQDKKGNAERMKNQIIEAFRKNQAHYTGMRRTFTPFSVDEQRGESAGERVEAETRLVKTVIDDLRETLVGTSEALDLAYQIDEANTKARASIVIDGVTLAENIPATYLLQLEKRLRELRSLLKETPTFDPVRRWVRDDSARQKHVLRADPVVTIRKQRTRKYNTMYEATKEHPAQVDVVEIDEPIGEIKSYDWTGMISPGKKAELLAQMDKLITAVKTARSRANQEEVDPRWKIADRLMEYLLQPVAG